MLDRTTGGLGLWVRSEWRHGRRSLVGLALLIALGGGGMLGAGVGLIFGLAMRITSIGSAILLMSMWLALAPWAKITLEDGTIEAKEAYMKGSNKALFAPLLKPGDLNPTGH